MRTTWVGTLASAPFSRHSPPRYAVAFDETSPSRIRIESTVIERLRERRERQRPGRYVLLADEILARWDGEFLAIDEVLKERIDHYAFDFGRGAGQRLRYEDARSTHRSAAPDGRID